LEKNEQGPNGTRPDDDRSPGASDDDEDVFVQAAAISGDAQNDGGVNGRYQVVDENGQVKGVCSARRSSIDAILA
jgi:hypothetical protein